MPPWLRRSIDWVGGGFVGLVLGVFVQPSVEDWREHGREAVSPTRVEFRPHPAGQCESGRIDTILSYVPKGHFAALDDHPELGWQVRLVRQARVCAHDGLSIEKDTAVNLLQKIAVRYKDCFRYVPQTTGTDNRIAAAFHLAPRTDVTDPDHATPLCLASFSKGEHTGNLWQETTRPVAEGTVFCMTDEEFRSASLPQVDLPACSAEVLKAIGLPSG